MIRYLLSKLEKRYLVPEQHELAQNGESFKILRKGPEVVAHQTAVERGMEKHGKHCGSRDEVVRFACVQIVVVTCPEGDNDAVQDISRQEQRQCLLHFENEIAGCVVRQVSLNHRGITLQNMNRKNRTKKMTPYEMKVSRERPVTERLFLILMAMSAKPNVWTVPARVKISENCPSLKTKQRMRMITASTPHDMASSFFMNFIQLLIDNLNVSIRTHFQYIQRIIHPPLYSILTKYDKLIKILFSRLRKGDDAFRYIQINKLHMSTNQGPTNFNQPQSLVKYSNPVLVSSSGKKQAKDLKINPQNLTNTYTEDILNSILPPREYTTEKQQLWIQSVSATPATKQDVLDLQEKLDKRLQQRQARETGICPIREELYSQCFDELIRQITINCAERGLLLVRVRDEIRSTIQSYQTLYESSIAFGMRRALQAEQKKKDMQNKISTLKGQTKELEEQVHDLQQKIADMEVKDKEQQESDRQAHKNNIEAQKRTNQILKEQLEKLLQGPQPAGKK